MSDTNKIKPACHIHDGYIEGYLSRRVMPCSICHHPEYCIIIETVITGSVIKPSNNLILFENASDNEVKQISRIGIGCGCYSRAHRQIRAIIDAHSLRRG